MSPYYELENWIRYVLEFNTIRLEKGMKVKCAILNDVVGKPKKLFLLLV